VILATQDAGPGHLAVIGPRSAGSPPPFRHPHRAPQGDPQGYNDSELEGAPQGDNDSELKGDPQGYNDSDIDSDIGPTSEARVSGATALDASATPALDASGMSMLDAAFAGGERIA
jgi:hypothetical protein